MLRFMLSRALQAAVVIVLVVTLVFTLEHIAPGDPFYSWDDPRGTPQEMARVRAQWGYDQPLWRQYTTWVGNLATGEFGWSHSKSMPVAGVLREVVPPTLLLMVPALVLGLVGGVALGTWQGARRDRAGARVASAVTLAFLSIPDFIVALAVLGIVAIRWHLAPIGGIGDEVHHDAMPLFARVRDTLAHLALPCMTLAALIAASVSRYQRTAVIGVMQEEFVRTARAKGASERRVLLHHVLRNSLGPAITMAGLLLPSMFAGAVFVEGVFAWPGMGRTVFEAIAGRDYALVQAIVLIGTLFVLAGGLAADIAAALVNPRLRLQA